MTKPDSRRVVIVGAGFAGLVAAWRLNKEGYDVTVFEKSNRTGGLIDSRLHRLGLVETAANGLLASKLVEELFEDCGLRPLVPEKSARRRYLAVDGEVTRFPLSILEAILVAVRAVRARRVPPEPRENLESWATRAFGRVMARKLVGPAMLGIYASPADQLSAHLIVGRFYDRSRSRNEKGRRRGTISSVGGMGELLKQIRQTIESRGVRILMGIDVADGGEGTRALREKQAHGTSVILATPAWEAARILTRLDSASTRIAALESIEAIPLITIATFFKRKPLKTGFGTLFCQTAPEGEDDGILGALQNSEIFAGRSQEGIHSETWILGGRTHGRAFIEKSDQDLIELVLEKRARWIAPDSKETLLEAVVTKWPTAIPHYGVQLETVRPILLKDEGGVLLFGNYLGELGLASILEGVRRLDSRIQQSKGHA